MINDALEVGSVDSAYADRLDVFTGFISILKRTQDLPDAVDADDIFGVLLRGGSIECSNAEIVCSSFNSYRGFLNGRHCGADDLVISKNATCFGNVHVILAQMNSFTSNGEGNIDSIVDEEGDVVLLAFLVELLGSSDEGTSVTCLVSILNNCYT